MIEFSDPVKVDDLLKLLTVYMLRRTNGNRTEAAALMGISVRTLRNWINRYRLARDYPPPRRGRVRKNKQL